MIICRKNIDFFLFWLNTSGVSSVSNYLANTYIPFGEGFHE